MATVDTPAVRALQRAGIRFELLQYDYDASADAIGLHAAHALGRDPATVFKTLIVTLDSDALICAVIPSSARLDRKAIGSAAGAKKAELADPKLAERATGYVVGGISPLGQRRKLPVYIDASATRLDAIIVNGGRRGLQVLVNPDDLVTLTGAVVSPLCA